MTAEIAILNKLAVALATDSAVTISSGAEEHKTYDSADKLFELSKKNPLGIMIYNGMQFMQAPLPMIICEYRAQSRSFRTVREAAEDFLNYLNNWGIDSPPTVLDQSIAQILSQLFDVLKHRINQKQNEFFEGPEVDFEKFKLVPGEVISVLERMLGSAPDSSFIGDGMPSLDGAREAKIEEIVTAYWPYDEVFMPRLVELAKLALTKSYESATHTGIVIAGFGSADKFPSMISFTIDGIVFDKLKFSETNFVDIDRNGDRARVMPFAQKEMVERFLYGLDSGIEHNIAVWCKNTVPEIRNQIISNLVMSENDKEILTQKAKDAEDAFIEDLQKKRFEEIRTSSQAAIEGMVEFMPKPELAKMAEALVNLTSIKRRVSRGMDTVGGPIDVAVISKTEGFIWVKRKHYFSSDLNPRYASRVWEQRTTTEVEQHAEANGNAARKSASRGRRNPAE